jgi:hypothetical protein
MASTDPTPHTDHPEIEEPFGQTGVRQYVGQLLSVFFVFVAIIAALMWYRSTQAFDRFEWRSPTEQIAIDSVMGRLRLEFTTFDERRSGNYTGWTYRQPRPRGLRDGWEPSLFKLIGIEVRRNDSLANGNGYWIRIKWYLIIVAALLHPLVRVILYFRRRERPE